MLEIMLGDVHLTSRSRSGLYGLYVEDAGFKGWEGGAGGRRENVVRPSAHGSYDLPVFREARVITINGFAVARSVFDLGNMRDLVTGVGSDGGTVRLSVSQHGRVLWADVRVLSVDFVDRGRESSPVGKFVIELLAVDPRKFGEPHEFTGSSVQVHHYGNFPASPVVTVAGPVTGPYTISGPGGRSVTVAQSLTAGQSHRFDMATGYLYRNGVRQLGQVTQFRPWTIPPNQRVAMSINKGSMTVKVTDTYM